MMITNFYFALIWIFAYLITVFCVIKFKKSKLLRYEKFPPLKLKKKGIFFSSNLTHRIKIKDCKVMQIDKSVYLNLSDKLIIISNVDDVKIYNDYLYFTALGIVEILVDLKDVYKYFAIQIKSEQFSLDVLKQQAILDLMNNNFDINFSKILKKYVKIIKNVLKIDILKEKIVINSNNFKLSFDVIYKVNNKIKRIKIC